MRMEKPIFGFMLLILFNFGCNSPKKVLTSGDITSFKEFLEDKSYEFVATTANPIPSRGMTAIANTGLLPPGSTMSNIRLQGTSNYLRVEGDTISASLPYYGERQSGGGYSSDAGIVFDGLPSNYNESYDSDKNMMEITFSISEKSEGYRVTMNLFPNKNATVVVTSSQRFAIRYLGEIKPLEHSAKE